MSKVIRISDSMYELIENTAFKNGVGIKHLAEKILEFGISECEKGVDLTIHERGRDVKIKW